MVRILFRNLAIEQLHQSVFDTLHARLSQRGYVIIAGTPQDLGVDGLEPLSLTIYHEAEVLAELGSYSFDLEEAECEDLESAMFREFRSCLTIERYMNDKLLDHELFASVEAVASERANLGVWIDDFVGDWVSERMFSRLCK